MIISSAVLISLLLSSASPVVVYDSGEPATRADGDVAFMSVWRVLDPADDLCVRVVVPIELEAPARVAALAFYSFNPKGPAEKLVDIYQGTDEDSVGTLLHQFSFEEHEGVRQGWNVLTLDQPIRLAAGRYGVAFHGRYEFHSYWAANAPNGPGYAWVRVNDDREWFKGGAEDFGVLPNFGIRVYRFQPLAIGSTRVQSGGLVEPATREGLGGKGPRPTPKVPLDTSVPGTPEDYEYEPGTAEDAFHVIWRPVLPAQRVGAEPK